MIPVPPEQQPVGVVDSAGNVVFAAPEALSRLPEGYSIATPEQLAAHQQVLDQAGPAGAVKAFGESALSTASFGIAPWLEKELGISTPEAIAAREQQHPVSSFLGNIPGVLVPVAGEEALAGKGLGGLARVAGGAPGLITDLGEATTAGVRGAMAPTSKLGRIGADVLAHGAGSAVEGAAYGLGQSVSEDALDPDMTVESAMARGGTDALLGAAFGGALGAPFGLVSSALKAGPTGAELADKLEEFAGERGIKSAGAIQSDIARAAKKTAGGRDDLIRQANEATQITTPEGKPILKRFNSPEGVYDRSSDVLDATGEQQQAFVDRAVARANGHPEMLADGQQLVNDMRTLLAKGDPAKGIEALDDDAFQQTAAGKIHGYLDFMQEKMDSTFEGLRQQARFNGLKDSYSKQFEGRMSVQDLWTLRKRISKAIYGWKSSKTPGADAITATLQDFRGRVSDLINTTIEKTGENSAEWKQLNRTYQVASTMQDFSGRALIRGHGNNLLSLTELGALGAGFLHGGPIGVLGPVAFIAARRHGSDLLAVGARSLSRALKGGEAAGHGLTPVPGLTHPAPIAGGSRELDIPHAKNAVEKAASIAPDASAEGELAPTRERVEALASLEKIQRGVVQDLDEGMTEIAKTGKPASRPAAPPSDEILTSIEKVNRLTSTPEQTAALVARMTDETHEHAPSMTSKTGEVADRALSYLQQEAPQTTKPFPLGPEIKPDRTSLLLFHEKLKAVTDPIATLRENPSAVAIAAIQAVYPVLLKNARTSLLSALASTGGHVRSQRHRAAIATILGTDLDGSQDPGLTAMSQAAFVAMSSPRPPRPRPVSVKTKSYAERLNPAGGSSLRNP